MNCHMCASVGLVNEAYSVCQECGAAVCQAHLEEAIVENRPQRIHLPGCTYALAESDKAEVEAPVAGAIGTMTDAAGLVQRDDVEQMWELHSTTDDSHPDYLTISEAAAWVAAFPSVGATTPRQVVQQSVRVLWDAAPRSSDPGSLYELLRAAINAVEDLSSLDFEPGQKPRDPAGLTEAAMRLFFARGRARANGHYHIAERLTELLWVLSAARQR
jgi:hypothetical protein